MPTPKLDSGLHKPSCLLLDRREYQRDTTSPTRVLMPSVHFYSGAPDPLSRRSKHEHELSATPAFYGDGRLGRGPLLLHTISFALTGTIGALLPDRAEYLRDCRIYRIRTPLCSH